jgi:hypothetical protein
VAAKNDASYDLSRARASVTGQTTIAASTATTSLPNGRIVTALFAGVAKGLPPDVVERIVIASGNAIRPA